MQQSIGGRFEVIGDAVDKMKIASIDVRADESCGDSALALIRLVLDPDHLVDCFEELLHVLAWAPTVDILRRANSALKGLRAFGEEISESEERRWQVRAHHPTRKEPGKESRLFKIIGRIIGDLQDSPKHLGSWDASNGQTSFLDDFVSTGFGQLCPHRVLRQQVVACGYPLSQGGTEPVSELDDNAGVSAGIPQ